jgi:EAL domain-containing protein (putative c-di-GMP-specific phosphodiesterase class I)
MLSAMTVDVLKMDRTFIRKIGESKKDSELVTLILGLARNLKIPVVAEGVENETQLRLLRGLGCQMVQGFYFSRPLPVAEFEKKMIRAMQGKAGQGQRG